MKRQSKERALFNPEMLKQQETTRKYFRLNLMMKSCLSTSKILGRFRSKDAVPGSSPIQTICKRTKQQPQHTSTHTSMMDRRKTQQQNTHTCSFPLSV